MKSFTVIALEDFPLIEAKDDVASLVVRTARKNGVEVQDGDILAIAQKVFSKAEGRIIKLRNVTASTEAEQIAAKTGKSARFIELVLGETKRTLKVSRDILLVEDKRGIVCINAGIDKSNVKGIDSFALLPENPDESAEKCRLRIRELTGKDVAVIMCDTYSRPFRRGQVNFAIGIAGMNPFKDYRGKKDLFGQILKVKNTAVADEIAAASELLMGQATEATPVIIIRGLGQLVTLCKKCNSKELYISSDEDLFKNTL